MNWRELAVKLGNSGFPAIGRQLGTLAEGFIPVVGPFLNLDQVGENIGAAVAAMLADTLGVEPTPEAISAAIDAAPTTEIAPKLQEVESKVAQWEAEARIAEAEEKTAQVQIAATQSVMKEELMSATMLTEGRWRMIVVVMNSLWRPLFALEFLAECAYLFFGVITIFMAALIRNDFADIDAMIKMLPLVTILLLPYIAMRAGLIGYHMNLRTREKEHVTDAVTESKPVSLEDVKAMLIASGVKVKK